VNRTFDVAVVGAGVIGLSVAWRAAVEGLSVVVCDPEPWSGASWAAAGMLAPSTEARWGEETLHCLAEESAAGWPDFATRLEDESGMRVGLRQEGTLSIALDPDDFRALNEAVEVQRRFGCPVELLSGRDCRRLESSLSPRVVGGALTSKDHQVDTRAVLGALSEACSRRRVETIRTAVIGVGTRELTLEDGAVVSAGEVVLAAGCGSAAIDGLNPVDVPPVRPVKGQILRLRSDPTPPVLTRTIRAVAGGRSVYLVPRSGGEIVVGATVEERGFDTEVTAGAVYELLRAAVAVVPDIVELPLRETMARSRPGSPDNGPILGPARQTPGLHMATGHFRHGVLLAPITAEALIADITGRPWPAAASAFKADRFGAREPVYE
jgi:glycine oxidase